MLLEKLARRGGHLEANHPEALLFEARDDLADEATLDAVRPARILNSNSISSCRRLGKHRDKVKRRQKRSHE